MPGFAAEDESFHRLRVCLVAGGSIGRHDEPTAALQAALAVNSAMTCIRVFCDSAEGLLGLECLDDVDCLVLFGRQITVVGASIGGYLFDNYAHDFTHLDVETPGDDAQWDVGIERIRVETAEGAERHPVAANVEPFMAHGTPQRLSRVGGDCQVLLVGTSGDRAVPVGWIERCPGARVFRTTLGHPSDFHDPRFVRLLTGAICWAGRRQE